MIGLSLIKVGIIDFGGGFAAKSSGTFGNYEHLGVGLLVLIVVTALTVVAVRCYAWEGSLLGYVSAISHRYAWAWWISTVCAICR